MLKIPLDIIIKSVNIQLTGHNYNELLFDCATVEKERNYYAIG